MYREIKLEHYCLVLTMNLDWTQADLMSEGLLRIDKPKGVLWKLGISCSFPFQYIYLANHNDGQSGQYIDYICSNVSIFLSLAIDIQHKAIRNLLYL